MRLKTLKLLPWCLATSPTNKNYQSSVILRPSMVLINLPTNAFTTVKLVLPRVNFLNLWEIQNGGIIVVIHEREITKRLLLL